jgi:glycine/D-amino acid oxidase-like deaminating enzyme
MDDGALENGIRPIAGSDGCDVLVIGGGFFGCSIALHSRRIHRGRVVVLESAPELLTRASYANQARVHFGYHYPRSVLTALRSRVNYPRFVSEFAECVDDSFDAYYAVARRASKVTAKQFRAFCATVGMPVDPAPSSIRRLFDADLVEDVFSVRECAFDATKLRATMRRLLEREGVEVRLRSEALRVRRSGSERLEVTARGPDGEFAITARRVFLCTYSRINHLLAASGLPMIPLAHELAEIALVEVPEEFARIGVTVMCGPYFSVMPFPARSLHSFSHVRYTPHCRWEDAPGARLVDGDALLRDARPASSFVRMVKDAQRYVPMLAGCRQVESLMEVKTVLPRSDTDDGRPILFRRNHGLPGLDCVTGAKIDNVYDAIECMSEAEQEVAR